MKKFSKLKKKKIHNKLPSMKPSSKTSARDHVLVAPTSLPLLNNNKKKGENYYEFEYSVHKCPKKHLSEIKHMFPERFKEKGEASAAEESEKDNANNGYYYDAPFLIVPTMQRTALDICKTGEAVDVEKDECLERFLFVAEKTVSHIESATTTVNQTNQKNNDYTTTSTTTTNSYNNYYWADYVDPCSGLPMRTKSCQRVYGEVDACETLLGYDCANVGCCKILSHPKWGSHVYPATIFTTAPAEVVVKALERAAEAFGNEERGQRRE